MRISDGTPATISANPLLSQWVRINPNRTISVFTGKVELGQGVSTALLQIACDALGVLPDQIDLVAGNTLCSPDEGYTAGSLSVQYGGAAIHWACSHLFSVCRSTVATRMGTPEGDLCVDAGIFTAKRSSLSLDYWSLAEVVPTDLNIKDAPKAQRTGSSPVVGTSLARKDFVKKFSGAAYIHDLVIPGMRHVRMLRGKHLSQMAKELPVPQLEALDGVDQVFASGNFVALIGKSEGALVRAHAKALKLLSFTAVDDQFDSHEPRRLLPSLPSVTTRVHTEGARGSVVNRHQAKYSRPYLAHASIGPACALANFENGQLTVWSHTQGPYQLREQIAAALKLDASAVNVIHMHGAGCYGHNGADDVAFDAALIALRITGPVRVQWMRNDEMTVSPFGSAGLVGISAGLDDKGRIGEWSMELWSHTHLNRPGWGEGINLLGAWEMEGGWPQPSPKDFPLPAGGADRNAISIYELPHQKIDYHFIAQSPVRVSALRSLGSYLNIFAIESFMDELAEIAGCDPIEFRLRHLSDMRAREVLKTVMEMSGWRGRDEGGTGAGLGIGFGRYKNKAAYCAIVAKVVVEEKIRVDRLWIAVDAGEVINPDGLINQVEGGAIQSLSWTLKEAVTWNSEGISSSDWENYPILGFNEIPEIEVHVLDRQNDPCLGAGEIAAGPTAAAVANAATHALGVRARHMPLTPERLLAAIESSEE